MIESVIWEQYINRHTDRHTDRHIATADVVPTHCVKWRCEQKKTKNNHQIL